MTQVTQVLRKPFQCHLMKKRVKHMTRICQQFDTKIQLINHMQQPLHFKNMRLIRSGEHDMGFIVVHQQKLDQNQMREFVLKEVNEQEFARKYKNTCICTVCGIILASMHLLEKHILNVHSAEQQQLSDNTLYAKQQNEQLLEQKYQIEINVKIENEKLVSQADIKKSNDKATLKLKDEIFKNEQMNLMCSKKKAKNYCGKCVVFQKTMKHPIMQLHFEQCHNNFIQKQSVVMGVQFPKTVYADVRIFYKGSSHDKDVNKKPENNSILFSCGHCKINMFKHDLFAKHIRELHKSVVPLGSVINNAKLLTETEYLNLSQGQKLSISNAEQQYLTSIQKFPYRTTQQHKILKQLINEMRGKNELQNGAKVQIKSNQTFGHQFFEYLLKLLKAIFLMPIPRPTIVEWLDELLNQQSEGNIGIIFNKDQHCFNELHFKSQFQEISSYVRILDQVRMIKNADESILIYFEQIASQNALYFMQQNIQALQQGSQDIQLRSKRKYIKKTIRNRTSKYLRLQASEFQCQICYANYLNCIMLNKHRKLRHEIVNN